jgi:hypothetical protein
MLLIILAALLQESKPVVLEAGPLTCEIHISRTAHLFHVVDQLAEWSEFCHRQYGRHFKGLDEKDRELLAKHAEIRKVRGWGGGLEQTFYSPLDVEAAIAAGIKAKHLTEAEAAVEREVFARFAPRVDALLAENRKLLESYPGRLARDQKRLAEVAARVSRFVGGAKVKVPVYLFANPHDSDSGGGFNGGVVTIEIPRVRDAYSTLVHEVFHAFLETRRADLEAAVKDVKGLDFMTLNEGLAYAISPGILHTEKPGSDPLKAAVMQYRSNGQTLSDYYYRVNVFGLALRPLMKEALDSDVLTLEKILPRAIDAWRVLAELESTSGSRYRVSNTPSIFIFGGGQDSVAKRFQALERPVIFGRHHGLKEYDEMFTNHNKPGDLVVLLLDLSSPERVPDSYSDLLPKPWVEIEATLKKGETIELEGEARQMRTVLLAAPTRAALVSLMKDSKLIR